MKMAPTPIGPKWPAKIASLLVLISGIQYHVARIVGSLLSARIEMARTMSLQGVSVRVASDQALKGIVAPT